MKMLHCIQEAKNERGNNMMYLKIGENKYYGETKEECLAALWKDPQPTAVEEKLMEATSALASEYIINNCCTEEEKEAPEWNDDLFGKYCTDEIMLKCFEEIVTDNPIIYRGIYFADGSEE